MDHVGKLEFEVHKLSLPPELKWKKTDSPNQWRRTMKLRPTKSKSSSSTAHSPLQVQATPSASPSVGDSPVLVSESTSSYSNDTTLAQLKRELCKSKILIIKLPSNNNNNKTDPHHHEQLDPPLQEDVNKIWNLKPQKPIHKKANKEEEEEEEEEEQKRKREKDKTELPPPKAKKESGDTNSQKEKKKVAVKRKLSIIVPLTKMEIEEDIFSITVGRLAWRPKKRFNHLHKNMDVRHTSNNLHYYF